VPDARGLSAHDSDCLVLPPDRQGGGEKHCSSPLPPSLTCVLVHPCPAPGEDIHFGFVGAIIAALVGAWLLTKVIVISGIGDINVFGVPIVTALVGAIILVAIWQLLAFRLRPRDRPNA
jgi:uncharacterized membrane protein YeaQ/YmgE (transglycosylase-associated protein family)